MILHAHISLSAIAIVSHRWTRCIDLDTRNKFLPPRRALSLPETRDPTHLTSLLQFFSDHYPGPPSGPFAISRAHIYHRHRRHRVDRARRPASSSSFFPSLPFVETSASSMYVIIGSHSSLPLFLPSSLSPSLSLALIRLNLLTRRYPTSLLFVLFSHVCTCAFYSYIASRVLFLVSFVSRLSNNTFRGSSLCSVRNSRSIFYLYFHISPSPWSLDTEQVRDILRYVILPPCNEVSLESRDLGRVSLCQMSTSQRPESQIASRRRNVYVSSLETRRGLLCVIRSYYHPPGSRTLPDSD